MKKKIIFVTLLIMATLTGCGSKEITVNEPVHEFTEEILTEEILTEDIIVEEITVESIHVKTWDDVQSWD